MRTSTRTAMIAALILAASAWADDVSFPNGMVLKRDTIRMFDDKERLSSAYLSKDFVSEDGVTMPAGTDIAFDKDGDMVYCTTKFDFRFPGFPYSAKAMTKIWFKHGRLWLFTLAEDWPLGQGIIAAAGTEITLYPFEGRPEAVILKEAITLPNGIILAAGSVVAFYEDGYLKRYEISVESVHPTGFVFQPGMRVTCDKDGAVSSVSYVPAKNYKDPQAGFVIKKGTEAVWDADLWIGMATFASSWKDPRTGIIYPAGRVQYISDKR